MASAQGETRNRKTKSVGEITPADGGVEFALSPTDTDQRPGVYYHVIKVFDPAGCDVAAVMTGFFRVRRVAAMSSVRAEPAPASATLTTEPPTAA
jgi:hypothetical protein